MYNGKKVCVIIPAYDEEASIAGVIKGMPDFVDAVLAIDDGSSDRTAEIARAEGATVVSHNRNKGVGAAFSTGMQEALEMGADIMVNIDADGQFAPHDIEKLIKPIDEGKADFVSASRFKDRAYYPVMPPMKFFGNKLMAALVSRISGQKFYDVSCGFRAFSRDALLKLNLFGDFTYTQETFLGLAFKDVSIMEVPIKVRGVREHGKSKVASSLVTYGWRACEIILKTYRDYKPLALSMVIAGFSFIVGALLGMFLLVHFIVAGAFYPHKWAGFLGGFFILISVLVLAVGFILDMFARMRQNQEKLIYLLGKEFRRRS